MSLATKEISLVVGTMKNSAGRLLRAAPLAIGLTLAGAAVAQEMEPNPQAFNSAANLKLPDKLQLFGTTMPSVVKATAIVNGEVITRTDIDQRLALMAIANGGQIPANEIDRLRQQVLSNLIDETLQIQAAKKEEIEVTDADIDKTVARLASSAKQTPQEMAAYLHANGSSMRSIRRQIQGELAWSRLQSRKIESVIDVNDQEVQAVIDKLNASKGTEEYRVSEIFLSSTPANDAEVLGNMQKIAAALAQGGSFLGYARQFSESSSAAVGGDLGWLRPEQLPDELATWVRQMHPGQLSQPIKVAGGYSLIYVQDERKVLGPDPRNAELSLKQISISFPKGTTRQQAEPILAQLAAGAQNVGGCGGAAKLAADLHGDIVESDQVKMRDLPPALQNMMMQMQVGQATQPFGSLEDGVRVLVLCGRDEVDPSLPTFEQVSKSMIEERVNLRSRRYLRDLRRDAIIDYR